MLRRDTVTPYLRQVVTGDLPAPTLCPYFPESPALVRTAPVAPARTGCQRGGLRFE